VSFAAAFSSAICCRSVPVLVVELLQPKPTTRRQAGEGDLGAVRRTSGEHRLDLVAPLAVQRRHAVGGVVAQHRAEAPVGVPRDDVIDVVAQQLIAELIEKPVGVKGRLGDALEVDQAEAAVKGGVAGAGLLEAVGERPVRQRLGAIHRAGDGADDERGARQLVVQVVAGGGAGVPLRAMDLQPRAAGGPGLAAQGGQVLGGAAHRAAQARRVLAGQIVQREVAWVRVCADEVDRQFVLGAVAQKRLDPHRVPDPRLLLLGVGAVIERLGVEVARRRPADPQRRVDGLEGPGGGGVKLEVLQLAVTVAVPEVRQVRLVPHLEAPPCHLIPAVAVDAMAHERLNQRAPPVHVRRRRRCALPPEAPPVVCRQRLGHESQLNERPHAQRQHAIEQLVDVLPVVDQLALAFATHEHLVVEQPVEAHRLEAAVRRGHGQMLLPVGAQSLVGPSGPDATRPEMIQGAGGAGHIDAEVHGLGILPAIGGAVPRSTTPTTSGTARYPAGVRTSRQPARPAPRQGNGSSRVTRRDRGAYRGP
jgi:hypothetical protein